MPKKLIMFAFLASLLVASLLMFVIPVSAAGFKFSGTFDGTEAEAVLPSCGVLTSYDVVGSVQVSVSGDYNYSSISSYDEVAISADVYVNSNRVDVTPLKKPIALQPGEYQLLLKNPNYSPWNRFVTVTAGDTQRITVRLLNSNTP